MIRASAIVAGLEFNYCSCSWNIYVKNAPKMWFKLKYTIAGICIGAIFPLAAWILDLSLNELEWSLGSLLQLHFDNPLHYIIDLAPLVLGLVFFAFGRYAEKNTPHFEHELSVAVTAFFPGRKPNFGFISTWVLASTTIVISVLVIFSARSMWVKTVDVELVEATFALTDILQSNKDSVEELLQTSLAVTEVLSAEDESIHYAEQLLLKQNSKRALRTATEQLQFASWIEGRLVNGVTDAAIMSVDGIILAAFSADRIGESSNFSESGSFIRKIADHRVAICRPCDFRGNLELAADSDISSQNSFLVGHQIIDDSGRFIAILMLRLELFEKLSTLLLGKTFGRSGEIYAVNEFGYIISSVRFGDLDDDTQAARRLLHSGLSREHLPATESSLFSHRDYREIPVLARHVWLGDLNVGLVAQSSVEEVYSRSSSNRRPFALVTTIMLALIIGIAFSIFKLLLKSKQVKLVSMGAKHQIQLLMNTAAEGIYGIDMSGNCTFANRACWELTGYENEADLLGKNMHELIHHSFKDKSPYRNEDCKIYKAFRNGLNVHVDNEVFWRADGSCFDAEYHSNPIYQGRSITGAVVTFTDISQRVANESADALTREKLLAFRNALDELSQAATLVSVKSGTVEFFENAARILANVLDVDRVGIWRFSKDQEIVVADCLFNRRDNQIITGKTLSKDDAPLYFEHLARKQQSISDLENDERSKDAFEIYFKPLGIFAILSAPMIVQGQSVGVLTFSQTKVTRIWDEHDDQFAISAALTLSVATETAQKLATEHRQQEIVETMVDGLITIGEAGVIESFNPAAEIIFGYKRKQVIGKNITMLMDSPYREQHQGKFEKYRKGAESTIVGKSGIEVEGLHKSGRRVPISISVSEMEYAGRRVFSGVIRDITEQMQMQREREAAMADTRKIIDSANAPIFGVNKHLQITEWNNFVTELTGYEKDEVQNRSFVNEFIDEPDRQKVSDVLSAALTGKQTQSFEATLITKTGEGRKLLLSAAPRYDIEGNVNGIIAVGQDITELRQKDAALRQALKMEAVGQLTGGIAHDFNNLLSIIKGNLRFLQEDVGDLVDGTKDLFDDAMSAVEDGTALTGRLLAFSRTGSLQAKPMDVCKSISEYSKFLVRTIGGNYELRTEVPIEPVYIEVDSGRLDNALLNLVINARDAMPDGGQITIGLEVVTIDANDFTPPISPGPYVRVSVTDYGIGIEPKNIQNIFDPFFTTKSVEKGSGLGLSMVYGFAQQSDGACRVESKLGKGSTISMFLPLTDKSVTDKPEAKSVDHIVDARDAVILIVEDDSRVRRTVIRDFEKMGFSIIEADSADAAQDIIMSGEHIDLVFTDILMPGKLDGLTLAQWIKTTYGDMNVVLTSGYSDKKTGISLDDHFPMIRKPYALDALSKLIRATLFSQ